MILSQSDANEISFPKTTLHVSIPYCATYYVHVLRLENTTNNRGNRGLPCKSPLTPGQLIDAPPPE